MRGSYLGGGAVMGTKSSPSNRGKDEDIAPSGRGQTDRGYKKPVTNTDNEIAIPLGMKRIPDN